MKIQRMADLEAEMRKGARGETAASSDAAAPSAESAKACVSEETFDEFLTSTGTLEACEDQAVTELNTEA